VFRVATEVLSLDGVSKRYGDVDALRRVDLSIRSGEAVGYLGPNGAGKSTTLKILAGLSRPTSGSARVVGRDPCRDRVAALRRLGALVETPGVPPYLTGTDLLEYVARIRGTPGGQVRAAARAGAEMVGVGEHLERPFGALSTGLSRRMMLAAALVGDPEVLLLDEPTLGLDPAARHDLRVTLRTLARKGLTVLLSTHLLDDVEEVCGRVVFLRAGSIVGDEPVRLEPDVDSARPGRTLRFEFGGDVDPATFSPIVGSTVSVRWDGPRHAIVRFDGGDDAQAALVAAVVRGGLPLLAASAPESDLARRYLQRVGREDAT
jgi:ABC-2 type transport system ATP-binding protein